MSNRSIQNEAANKVASNNPETFSTIQLIVGGVGLLAFITVLVLGINAIGVERLQQAIQDAGVFAPLVYIAIKALTNVFAPLTSGPIQVVAGTLFDSLWLGVLYTLIGEVLGGSIAFWIARRFGQPVIRRFVGEKGLVQISQIYEKQLGGWISLAVARVFLFGIWDFISYAAGLARIVKFRTYLLISIILGALPTFFFVWIGTVAMDDMRSLYIIYGLVALVVLAPIAGRGQIERFLEWSRTR